MRQVYIKDNLNLWKELDLEDEDFGITYQSNDVGDLSTRNISFSNTIKVPKTPKNLETLNYISLDGNTSILQYTKFSVLLIEDGIEVLGNWVGYIKDCDEYINLNIFDNFIDLKDILSDKKLSDLDFSALNHNLNYQTLLASLTNTSGYVYTPSILYKAGTLVSYVDYMVPNLFWKTIWDKIFTEAGISYSGSFFSSNDATTLIVGMETGGNSAENIFDAYRGGGTSQPNRWFTRSVTETSDLLNKNTNYIRNIMNFNSFSRCNMSYGNEVCNFQEISSGGAVSLQDGDYIIGVNEFYMNQGTNLVYLFLQLYINNTLVKELDYTSYLSSPQFTISGEVDLFKVFLYTTDTFRIALRFRTSSSMPNNNIGYTMRINDLYVKAINNNVPIDFSSIIGETKQIDFVKDSMIMFGLTQNKIAENSFQFDLIKDTLQNNVNAEDWSNLVTSDTIKEEYTANYGDLNAQNNYFKYKFSEDADSVFMNAFNGNLKIANTNLPLERDFHNSIYTVPIGYPAFMIAFDEDGSSTKTGLKLSYLSHNNGAYDWSFSGLDYGQYSFTGNLPICSFSSELIPANNISGNSFISRYYNQLNSVLNKFKRCVFKALINPLVLSSLSFNKLKFIQRTGKYYYLNKIRNKKNNEVCDIELIELPS